MSVHFRTGHARLYELAEAQGVAFLARACGVAYHAIRGVLAGAVPRADLALVLECRLGIPLSAWGTDAEPPRREADVPSRRVLSAKAE